VIEDLRDITLLNLLQADADATAETMSGPAALSSSALLRRLRRLRSSGAIRGTHAELGAAVTERLLRAVVIIEFTEHAHLDAIRTLLTTLRGEERVQLVFKVAGEIDLVIFVVTHDMAEFNRLAETLLETSPIVRRYRSHFVKDVIKQSSFVRLDARDLAPSSRGKRAGAPATSSRSQD
jgi:DNA-binding Lrp family transcriptional regulator